MSFLVGAGCSIDPPSCLLAGRQMMDEIIKFSCPKSEQKKNLNISELRFEQFVEIIQNRETPFFDIIEYYDLCEKPNLQHFFLAQMIKEGHYLITTNFDCLIEYALLNSNIPKEDIIPVITKEDFNKYRNPDEWFNKRKFTIYKVHGSVKNIITGENTKNNLIDTIHAFGSNKEGHNIFQIEPFKCPIFENISKNRSLIVMGYSGSDDFDIVPTLKVLNNFRSIIWINFDKKAGSNEKIYEIEQDEVDTSNKVTQILIDIKKLAKIEKIYLVNVNTSKLVERLLNGKPKISKDNFSVDLKKWFNKGIKPLNPTAKLQIAQRIYTSFYMFEDALRCLETAQLYASNTKDSITKALTLYYMGKIYKLQGLLSKAKGFFEEALIAYEEWEDPLVKSRIFGNLGELQLLQGNLKDALIKYEETLRISKKHDDYTQEVLLDNKIGQFHQEQGNYDKALKYFEMGLKINEKKGDLLRMATSLNNLGDLYRLKKNYIIALDYLNKSLKITKELKGYSEYVKTLNNIAMVHDDQGNHTVALTYYNEALELAESKEDYNNLALILNNVGQLYRSLGNVIRTNKTYKALLGIV